MKFLGVVALGALAAGVSVGAGRDGEEQDTGEPEIAEVFAESDRIFPERRVVAFYGAPQDEALGALGDGKPADVALRLRQQADAYDRPNRPVVPALELISTIVHTEPGEDGLYRIQQDDKVIERYLKLARSAGAILLLDIQPGHAEFMDEVQELEGFLREPDVGVALDPEWNLGSTGGIPGEEIGSMDADEVNEISEYLQGLADEEDLPQKLLVVHQFTDRMITNKDDLIAQPDIAVTLNVDGVGDPPNKVAKYKELHQDTASQQLPGGFKLFYEEDTDLMQPQEVLRLRPQPDFVVYE